MCEFACEVTTLLVQSDALRQCTKCETMCISVQPCNCFTQVQLLPNASVPAVWWSQYYRTAGIEDQFSIFRTQDYQIAWLGDNNLTCPTHTYLEPATSQLPEWAGHLVLSALILPVFGELWVEGKTACTGVQQGQLMNWLPAGFACDHCMIQSCQHTSVMTCQSHSHYAANSTQLLNVPHPCTKPSRLH